MLIKKGLCVLMDSSTALLLFFFALGSYIQVTAGFAFGLIVMSSVSALGLAPIGITAFAVSFLSMTNAALGLYGGHWKNINQRGFFAFILLCSPFILVGIWLLNYLGENAVGWLKMSLGVCLVLSSLTMMLQVNKVRKPSSTGAFAASGILSGLMGGMFGTFGPPITFMMYRQPDEQARIRATLLSVFCVAGIVRISSVSAFQGVDVATLWFCALGFPVVMTTTLLAKRFPLPISNKTIRFVAFSLLILSGLSLIWQGI